MYRRTNTGRVVYDRAPHKFSVKDVVRIMPKATLQELSLSQCVAYAVQLVKELARVFNWIMSFFYVDGVDAMEIFYALIEALNLMSGVPWLLGDRWWRELRQIAANIFGLTDSTINTGGF